jgi:hypothetical protein
MGNSKGKLTDAIYYNLPEQVTQILNTNPDLLNQFLDSYQTSYPLIKAVSLNRGKIVAQLLEYSDIKINMSTSTGETPIMRAAKFGLSPLLIKLHNKGADLRMEDKEGRNALDYAIIYGKFNCAKYIYKHEVELKTDDFYNQHKQNFGDVEVDLDRVREMLQSGVEVSLSEEKHKVMRKRKKIEMVFDPNETYTEMFKSLVSFSKPKMIPRDQVKDPKDLPENKSFRGLRQVFNWRGTNYFETVKEPEVEEDEQFVEMEDVQAGSYAVNDIENKHLQEVEGELKEDKK